VGEWEKGRQREGVTEGLRVGEGETERRGA